MHRPLMQYLRIGVSPVAQVLFVDGSTPMKVCESLLEHYFIHFILNVTSKEKYSHDVKSHDPCGKLKFSSRHRSRNLPPYGAIVSWAVRQMAPSHNNGRNSILENPKLSLCSPQLCSTSAAGFYSRVNCNL